MSVFVGVSTSAPLQQLQTTDARAQQATYAFDFSGKAVDIRPWSDGILWGRSRLGGSDSAGIVLGNDFQSAGRWDNDTQDILGGSQSKKLIGSTLDSSGNPLGSCVVQGFLTATDMFVGQTVSDSGGYYELPTNYAGQQHYLVAYQAGSPDRAGSTVNTLIPV